MKRDFGYSGGGSGVVIVKPDFDDLARSNRGLS